VRGSSVLGAGLYLLPTAAAMAVCPSLATWLTSKTGSARLPLLTGGLALMISTNSFLVNAQPSDDRKLEPWRQEPPWS